MYKRQQLGIVKLGLNLSGSRQNIDEPTTSVTGEGLMRYLTWFTSVSYTHLRENNQSFVTGKQCRKYPLCK